MLEGRILMLEGRGADVFEWRLLLLDMVRGRADPGDVRKSLVNTAMQGGKPVRSGSAAVRAV
jgi:hypothetical protein